MARKWAMGPPVRGRRQTGRNKFGAVRTVVDGVTFASKAEARRYAELALLQKAGKIRNLELQPRYRLEVNGVKVCDYVADFRYRERREVSTDWPVLDWPLVVEDVKGAPLTAVYKLKRKLTKALHGVEIREVRYGKISGARK